MHEHVERQGGGRDVEELGHEHQVAGTRHRQELREPLHHSEYESIEDGQAPVRPPFVAGNADMPPRRIP